MIAMETFKMTTNKVQSEKGTHTPLPSKKLPIQQICSLFPRDYQFWNVFGISVGFMVLYSAYHTCGMLQASVLDDVQDEYFNGTGEEGYYSAATLYTVMAAGNWIAPSIIAYTGPKYGMFLGAVPYCLFMAVFLRPFLGTLYASSVLLGIGSAVLWTSQGLFLTINSTEQTISRNSGMFWAIWQLSMLWGNIFATIELTSKESIDAEIRRHLFIGLLCVAIVGVSSFLLLRYPGARDSVKDRTKKSNKSAWIKTVRSAISSNWREWTWIGEVTKSLRLMKSRNMLLLSATFAYTGFIVTFYSGVFGTAIHFTKRLGIRRNALLGLSGVVVGVGEITGGILFGLLGARVRVPRIARASFTLLGIALHLVAYLLLFLSLPTKSPWRQTGAPSYIQPNEHVILLCAYLLGFGDAAVQTQIYSTIANLYHADSAPAFGVYLFTHSLTSAIGFFYSAALTLPAQLGILTASGICGGLNFCLVEWFDHKDRQHSPPRSPRDERAPSVGSIQLQVAQSARHRPSLINAEQIKIAS